MAATPLPPAFVARSQAVQAAHAHLASTRPDWSTLSPQDRIRAVHHHLAQPPAAGLRDLLTQRKRQQIGTS